MRAASRYTSLVRRPCIRRTRRSEIDLADTREQMSQTQPVTPYLSSAELHSAACHRSGNRGTAHRLQAGGKTTLGSTGADNRAHWGSHPHSVPYRSSAARELPRAQCVRSRSKATDQVSCTGEQAGPSAVWLSHRDTGAVSRAARRESAAVEQCGRRPTWPLSGSVPLRKRESSLNSPAALIMGAEHGTGAPSKRQSSRSQEACSVRGRRMASPTASDIRSRRRR